MSNKSSFRGKDLLLNVAVVVSTLGATYAVSNRLIERSGPSIDPRPRMETVVEWEEYGWEGNRMGPLDAPITIVNFSDFSCPYSKTQAPVLKAIRNQFAEQVAVVYRHQPSQVNDVGRGAAIASECAARLDSFEAYHDLLFHHSDSLGTRSWTSLAHEAGIPDTVAFRTCLTDSAVDAIVDRDVAAAAKLGAVITPTLLINDLKVLGYTDRDTLTKFVRAAIGSGSLPR